MARSHRAPQPIRCDRSTIARWPSARAVEPIAAARTPHRPVHHTTIMTGKTYILFDHDGVLVDTEHWYYTAGARALATIGLDLPKDEYLDDMTKGKGTWAHAKAAGVDDSTIDRLRAIRDECYRDSLRTEAIEIAGVTEALAELSKRTRMAIVTTAKRSDFEIIHEHRQITQFMDFVLAREDYELAKPHPEPYLTALDRFGATKAEALVVEDSARGLASAVAAGVDCAVVYNEFVQGGDFSLAAHRIDQLIDLVDIIDRGTERTRRSRSDLPHVTNGVTEPRWSR